MTTSLGTSNPLEDLAMSKFGTLTLDGGKSSDIIDTLSSISSTRRFLMFQVEEIQKVETSKSGPKTELQHKDGLSYILILSRKNHGREHLSVRSVKNLLCQELHLAGSGEKQEMENGDH